MTISDPDFRGQGGLAGSERYLVPRMDGPIVLTQGERGRLDSKWSNQALITAALRGILPLIFLLHQPGDVL